MKVLGIRLLILLLVIIRFPVTVYRFFRAYHYALYIDRRVTHGGQITLATPYGDTISYVRGKGLTLLKFIGAFNDRR